MIGFNNKWLFDYAKFLFVKPACNLFWFWSYIQIGTSWS